jgi:hypothetical protein
MVVGGVPSKIMNGLEPSPLFLDGPGNWQKNNLLNNLRLCEACAAMHQNIKVIRGKHHSSSFTVIDVPLSWPAAHSNLFNAQSLPDPKQSTEWKTVNLPDEII